MTFFNQKGNQIPWQQWLSIYEPYYFLNGPTLDDYGHWIDGRNQTSWFVESSVCALLNQTTPLSSDDLTLAMAWKIGAIDHHGSEIAKTIRYRYSGPSILKSRGHALSPGISYLTNNMSTILQQLSSGNPQHLFKLHRKQELEGFGQVHVVTVLFFVTQGKYPIYDRFAHVAAQAIDRDLPPGSCVKGKTIHQWSDYVNYMNLLSPISKACPPDPAYPSMYVSRPADRALWVYGHFFPSKEKEEDVDATKSGETPRPAPIMIAQGAVLVGRIRDLCQLTADGWRRREIIIRQTADGYPKERDYIDLIDSSGAKYSGLPLIKGSGVHGYVLLGRPGKLKPWFTRKYPKQQVIAEDVYFQPTGASNEYRIYSKSEWKGIAG